MALSASIDTREPQFINVAGVAPVASAQRKQ